MTKEQAEFLMRAAEQEGIEATIRNDYSGRGMYGKMTHAITVDDPLNLLVAAINAVAGQYSPFRTTAPVMGNLRTDNMGRSQIIY